MWLVDVVILALFLLGVFIYEIAEYKTFSLLYVIAVLVAGYFFFGPFKDFVLVTGWKVLLLKWFPIYLAVGVGVALLKWILLNFKVAAHIRDTKEGLSKIDFVEIATKAKNQRANEKYERDVEEAKTLYARGGSGYDFRNLDNKERKPLVLPDAPVQVAPTTEEVDAARREHFIQLWNDSDRDHDLTSVSTTAQTDWKDPEIIVELLTPRAKKKIDVISWWVLEWPFVIVSTVIGDFLIKFGKHVAKLFDRLFTGMGKMLVRWSSQGI